MMVGYSAWAQPEAITSPGWRHLTTGNNDLEKPSSGNQQTSAVVFDINRDGVNDFVITERTQAPAVVGYLRTASGWDRIVVEPGQLRIEAGSLAHDIDGDGDLDLIAGGDSQSNEVWWWENPHPRADNWPRRTIKRSGANKHHDQATGDFDGDGEDELVFWNQGGRYLYLAEKPENLKSAEEWDLHVIYEWGSDEMQQRGSYPTWRKPNEHEGFAIIDVDGDGKIDVVGGGRWFKHVGGTTYLPEIIDASFSFSRSAAGQFIEGGRPEVILVPGDGTAPMIMYEWREGTWYNRNLLNAVIDGHSITIADFNGDGHLDIFNAEMQLGENPSPKTRILIGDGKGNFKEQLVQEGIGLHESILTDLDGDGDLDILGKPYTWDAPRLDIWLNEGAGKSE